MTQTALRDTALALLASATTFSCSSDASEAERERPNVLLITLDTTRADRLGCYGYGVDTSPNLDALAADGVRFDLAISTAAVTPMSHASILTGLNPDRHGLRVFYGMTGHTLTDEHVSLATILGAEGWRTGAFISAYPASERFGLNQGFETFDTGVEDWVQEQDPGKLLPREGAWQSKRVGPAQRRADATTDGALSWLGESDEPFFLWLHYFDPHDSSLVPSPRLLERFSALPTRGKNPLLELYDAEIFFMDRHIGRVLDELRASGRYDDTIVVAIADHGQGLGDHDWFPHRLLYQEQIRVPMICRFPGLPRGVEVSALVRNIDVFPTILEALGLEGPDGVQGESLAALVRGEEEPGRYGYAEALNTIDVHAPPNLAERHRDLLFTVMDRDWKLIHHKERPENSELYDLREDPGETRNVIGENPEVARRLRAELDSLGAMEIEIREPATPMSEEAAAKLRALGYGG